MQWTVLSSLPPATSSNKMPAFPQARSPPPLPGQSPRAGQVLSLAPGAARPRPGGHDRPPLRVLGTDSGSVHTIPRTRACDRDSSPALRPSDGKPTAAGRHQAGKLSHRTEEAAGDAQRGGDRVQAAVSTPRTKPELPPDSESQGPMCFLFYNDFLASLITQRRGGGAF